jgi:Xaa-Pro aminopeptidase
LIKERIKKFWQEINKGIIQPNAFLVINPKNIFYLTQFKGEGLLLSTPDQNYLITDSRYTKQAKTEVQHCDIIIQELKQNDAQTISLSNLIAELKIKELGYESDFLKVSNYQKYQQVMPQLKLFPFSNILEIVRMVKDQSEINLIKKAVQIADTAFQETVGELSPGISELALANRLNYNMRKEGATKEAFDLIVTSGERGVLVHGAPSDKQIKDGELIVIDFGSNYGMYNSDCTRTLILGKPDKEQEKIFNIIKQVQIETLQRVKAGIQCKELDEFARLIIEESGYGDFIQHSLGHGVGVDIHELPHLNSYDQTILQSGMVVTIEPGIYVPGLGGVRIEDTIVITEKGCHILTMLPKELSLAFYSKKIFI